MWRQYVEPERLPEAVYPEEYELTYRLLLSQAKEQWSCQLILIKPFIFRFDIANPIQPCLRSCTEVVHAFAGQFDAVPVTLENRIEQLINEVPGEIWSADLIHHYI